MATMTRRFTPTPDAIYLCDNGMSLCGEHLGMTAAWTGRDVSGQKILRVSAADAAWMQQHNQAGQLPKCEACKKVWKL